MKKAKVYKPETKRELKKLIELRFNWRYYDLNDIDTSLITDMSDLFKYTSHDFNVSKWDTSNVIDMRGIFYSCPLFNSNIGDWNVENVRDMSGAFLHCTKFNQDIGKWNTKNVVNMERMFWDCTEFNQDIGGWNVENVRNIDGMFCECPSFNQDLGRWNMRNCKYTGIFCLCPIKEGWKPKYCNLYERKYIITSL